MITYKLTNTVTSRIIRAITITTAMLFMSLSLPVSAQQITMETMLDHMQIQDLLTRYYSDLSQGKAHELSEYFTEDAVLQVDDMVAHGQAEIAKLYQRPAPDPNATPAQSRGRGHMLLTNPIIDVHGDTATAHLIWTGVMNQGIGKLPYIFEQGREDDELVKQNGKWLIKRRVITADGRLPNRFDKNYKTGENP